MHLIAFAPLFPQYITVSPIPYVLSTRGHCYSSFLLIVTPHPMLDPRALDDYHALLPPDENQVIQERLELFQVFSKLYDHHRELLNDLLVLEDSLSLGNHVSAGHKATPFYVQGIASRERIELLSNLVSGESERFAINQFYWTLGRDPRQSTLAIRDKCLSRCHAAIQYKSGEGFSITDLESTNGTFINGERVLRVSPLRDGDRVRLGSLTFHFFACDVQKKDPAGDIVRPSSDLHIGDTSNPAKLNKPLDYQSTINFIPTDLPTDLSADVPTGE
jgi:FHA domain